MLPRTLPRSPMFLNARRSLSVSSSTSFIAPQRSFHLSPSSSASSTTRPIRPSYVRELPTDRDLPRLKSRTPLYLSLALISATSWGLFLFYATNAERSNSSVVGSLAFQLRTSQVVKEFLGDRVHLPAMIGEFRRVKGSINMLAGRIDVQFRVQGDQASGTAIFTSVRRGKEGRFEVLRWKIIRDGDGQVLDLRLSDPRSARAAIASVEQQATTTEPNAGDAAVSGRVV